MTLPRKRLQRRHLETLVAVGDSRSVHGAARRLGMAQPAVSRLLAEAETLTGQPLFERSAQGSEPTPYGAMLLAQARVSLRGLERLDDLLGEPGPVVRLGCIPRAMHTLMPELLNLMFPVPQGTLPGPGFRLDVIEEGSIELFEALRKGKLDFAVLRHVAGAEGIGAELVAERLYDERPLIICAAGNRDAPRGPVNLSRLMRFGWVLPAPESTSRLVLERFLGEQGLPPIQPVIETRTFESNLALVAGTGLISIVPESIARRHAALGVVRVLNVRPVLPGSPVMLVGHPPARDDPVLARFQSLAREAAGTVRARRE